MSEMRFRELHTNLERGQGLGLEAVYLRYTALALYYQEKMGNVPIPAVDDERFHQLPQVKETDPWRMGLRIHTGSSRVKGWGLNMKGETVPLVVREGDGKLVPPADIVEDEEILVGVYYSIRYREVWAAFHGLQG